MINPVEWASYIYGKLFLNHPFIGYLVFAIPFAMLTLLVVGLIWMRGMDKYAEQQKFLAPPQASTVSAAPPVPITIQAPQGIAVTGGLVVNPTVNNAVPNRHLSEQQKTALDQVAAHLPTEFSQHIYVKVVNDAEAGNFGHEISERFGDKARHIETALVWTPSPVGLFVAIHDRDDPSFDVAQSVANALAKGGHKVEFIPATWVAPHDVCIVVGAKPEGNRH